MQAAGVDAHDLGAGLRPVLDRYVEHLAARGLSANTLLAYERDLQRYVAYLGSIGRVTPEAIVGQDVEGFVVAVRTGADGRRPLSEASAARMVAAVRGWHRFLAGDGTTVDDAARGVRASALPRRLPRAISVEDVELLLVTAGHGDGAVAIRDRALLELLYSTGARISEVVGLDLGDVDRSERTPSVRLGAGTARPRIVPVGPRALRALGDYLAEARPVLATGAPDPERVALFLNSRGARLSRQSGWAVLRAAAHRAGLQDAEHVSPHTLRHSFAVHMLAGGADVRAVQALLGHASLSTTQLYTPVGDDALRAAYTTTHPHAR